MHICLFWLYYKTTFFCKLGPPVTQNPYENHYILVKTNFRNFAQFTKCTKFVDYENF